MYTDFYHLSEKPFNITPDPKFLYLNARYREALATLNYGIAERKGFITLIGEAGTGKTTLLNKLLDQLGEKTKTVFIFNTNVTFEEILEYMFNEFDLPVHSGKKLYMLQRLNSFLLEELRGGGNVAVLIDEAQDLDITVLENLRLLSNLETAKEKILQIVLSGQPELEKKLGSPELRQLRQRITVNCRLSPLTRDELSEYIEFRLQAAGCTDPKMFTADAEQQVWQFSHGIPRLVNVVCDNALVIGYALGKKKVSADIVREASADLLATHDPAAATDLGRGDVTVVRAIEATPAPAAAARSNRGAWALFALVAVALLVGFLSMGRRMQPRSVEQVLKPATSADRTVLHPGQRAEEVPPAQVGIDHPNMPRREQPVAAAEVPQPPPRPAEEHPLVDPAAGAGPAVEPAAASAGAPAPPAPQPTEQAVAPAPAPAAVAPRAEAPAPVAAVPAPELAAVQPRPAAEPQAAEAVEPRPAAGAIHAEEPLAAGVGGAGGSTGEAPAKVGLGEVRLSGAEFDRITVRDGDSVAQIAVRKYGQSTYTILDLLKLANPDLDDVDRISAGRSFNLPRLAQGFPIVQQEGRGYGVLTFSTPVSSKAQSLSKALRSHGFNAAVTAGNIGPGRTLQRVIIGPFDSEAEAAGASRDVQRAFREDEQLAALGRS